MTGPPTWVDRQRLARELCACETTIDSWVRLRVLPEPKKRGGKLLWRWETVDRWIEQGGDPEHTPQDNDRVVAMEEAMRKASRRR